MMYTFDPTNFNDPNSGSFYNYKVEDIICGRQPTINRIFISHRDLGLATITLTITGNDDSKNVISNSTTIALGTVAASGRIVTTVWDQISFTCQNPQISITRAANGGPVSITKLRVEGRVEK